MVHLTFWPFELCIFFEPQSTLLRVCQFEGKLQYFNERQIIETTGRNHIHLLRRENACRHI